MADSANDEHKSKESFGVLPKKLGGGPFGLGDPNDRSLRKVEKDVLVMQKLREKTRKEKCVEEVAAFNACCLDNQLMFVLNCRKENSAMRSCLEKWFKDEKFIQECTNEYLDERSEYRRTGITKKQKQFATRVQNNI